MLTEPTLYIQPATQVDHIRIITVQSNTLSQFLNDTFCPWMVVKVFPKGMGSHIPKSHKYVYKALI